MSRLGKKSKEQMPGKNEALHNHLKITETLHILFFENQP